MIEPQAKCFNVISIECLKLGSDIEVFVEDTLEDLLGWCRVSKQIPLAMRIWVYLEDCGELNEP